MTWVTPSSTFFYGEPDLEVKTTVPFIPPFAEEIKLGHLEKGQELAAGILRDLGYTYRAEEDPRGLSGLVHHRGGPADGRGGAKEDPHLPEDEGAVATVL